MKAETTRRLTSDERENQLIENLEAGETGTTQVVDVSRKGMNLD
jgi:hypothetical protein